ncbi:TM0106 family RecB-like putative nuclease [Nocardioides sp. AE5]|uniref:TM0106 family RecB-like putative nuclease n=1 Tax=Nocardioides sp. AE5 TaxID=2962573 RepID=UPI00288263A9|nr:TM0106 family RecB-like putative nuclease [Nocardioides sp. AE5]MDT0201686.1 TM0106 family RecB-like putative nuclease [Nocardioides sp. AE5]
MFLINDTLHWSASDLVGATTCEYAALRTLDAKMGRGAALAEASDPLLDHIAHLGEVHEQALLAERRRLGDVAAMEPVAFPYTRESLQAAAERTAAALADPAVTLVHQAAFFDGEFLGFADFLERTEEGWVVCDAKLARSARPTALLQLAAYADQMLGLGLPVARKVSLLLGDGRREDFAVADLLPVFAERRARLRDLLTSHHADPDPVSWGDERYAACGRCAECTAAAEAHDDLALVARMRMDQRRKLRDAGIATLTDLAHAEVAPESLPHTTFERLRAQARIQHRQRSAGPDAPVVAELLPDAARTLQLLPEPSPGDWFFDFEGDPLYTEADPTVAGLEYLWGIVDAAEQFTATWAHSFAEEKQAFISFLDALTEQRRTWPDMHVYHYAPYETSALKRLAMRYQVREDELDDLLRAEVFVDLYATVRSSVLVSQGSYSIKKLEPLYMGDRLRTADGIQAGDASILEYQHYRQLRDTDPDRAQAMLDNLADYNGYDCLSTLKLRDWLVERAAEAGVTRLAGPVVPEVPEQDEEVDPTFDALMARSGPGVRAERSPQEQSYAMLATAIDYYRRERKQFWWGHFERLVTPVEEWGSDTRDVFRVDHVDVVADWAHPGGRARNWRRMLRLHGEWAPGSKLGQAQVAYTIPTASGADGPEKAHYGAARAEEVTDDNGTVLLVESRHRDATFDEHPVALLPGTPPMTKDLETAIKDLCLDALASSDLPQGPALDLLARRTPRLRGGGSLPATGNGVADVTTALLGMDDSYVAVQGPPGTGKSWTGSRVIRELVEQHGWRIGVVAQSHAVVENLLSGVVAAGLDPSLVGKSKNNTAEPAWTDVANSADARAGFLTEHAATGCVLGGTAWTFASTKLCDPGELDLLVIDEAGQFALAPTLAASRAARRLLLLGDPQQLPQVTQGTHAEPVDHSALGWLMTEHETLPKELGYFLADSWRMHPTLCAKVSRLSYEGRLEAAPAASERLLEGVAPGLETVFVDHTDNAFSSEEEAAEVVRQVEAHLGLAWSSGDAPARPLTGSDILVVAPYNAQVMTIRKALADAGHGDVRVGTVDRFQGQQAPVVLVSMTASSPADVPRGMGFLLNRNRINVAISRAQWRSVLIRSRALTGFMPRDTTGLLELGAFIGLSS